MQEGGGREENLQEESSVRDEQLSRLEHLDLDLQQDLVQYLDQDLSLDLDLDLGQDQDLVSAASA